MSAERWRLFVALEPTAAARAELGARLAAARLGGEVRLVPAEQIHLTLVFLGGRPPTEVPALCERLPAAFAGARLPKLSFGALSGFPRPRSARVLFVEVRGGDAALAGIERAVRAVVHEATAGGVRAEDRPFVPHLTIARCARRPSAAVLESLAEALAPLRGAPLELARGVLMRSFTERGGVRYAALAAAPVARAAPAAAPPALPSEVACS